MPDIADLTEIILETYAATPYATTFNKKPELMQLNLLLSTKVSLANSNHIIDLVGLENGVVVGECEAVLNENCVVIGIIIKSSCRKKGYGTMLLKACIDLSKKLFNCKICAMISEKNIAGISFFKKNGFVVKNSSSKNGNSSEKVLEMTLS